MSFPTSPTNGQQANINGVTYVYSSALTAWTVSTGYGDTFLNISVTDTVNSGNLLATGIASVTGNITGGNILTGGLISATGNVTADYLFGNGSQLTGIAASYGNANVVANLAALGSNPVSTTGNITGGNVLGGANVNATTHTGTTVSVSANVTGGNILTGGLISATGNVTGNFFVGNGSLLTGIAASSYGNANVVANLAALGSNPVSTTGNVTGGNLRTSAAISAASISASGNITGGNILGGANVNATTHTGTTVSVSGNITAGNFVGNLTGTANTANYVYVTESPDDNVAYNLPYVSPSGAADGYRQLYSDATGITFNPSNNIFNVQSLTGTTVSASGNVQASNLNAVGLSLSGNVVSNLNVSGNITAGNISTAGNIFGNLTGTANTANYVYVTESPDDNVAYNLSYVSPSGAANGYRQIYSDDTGITFNPNTNLFSVLGNITGTNVNTGIVSATGNVTGGNLITSAAISGASVSASGNITGGNLIINGSISDSAQLDISTTAANANIVLTPNGTGNVNTGANVSVTGNITTTGTIKGASTIGVGNATPSTSGAGITFPATQSASSNANTLDDYEEGTWTPTTQNFTITGTPTLSGTYTKIGRVVYFNLSFTSTGTIAFGTSCLITLPFSGIDQSGMVAMYLQSNSESQTSGKSGVQISINAVDSRFFVGNFTTTSAGETLLFGGFYRVS